MRAMLLENSRWRKLTELMPDHVFSNKDRIKDLTVVNEESVSDKLRRDRRAARPSFDRLFDAARIHFVDLVKYMLVNERTFFK